MMDSTKFGLVNTHCICTIDGVDAVITDNAMTDEQRQLFIRHGVTVI